MADQESTFYYIRWMDEAAMRRDRLVGIIRELEVAGVEGVDANFPDYMMGLKSVDNDWEASRVETRVGMKPTVT